MTSVFAIVRRILTQFALDKRTLALLFVAPLVVLWLLSVILGADTVGPKIATVDLPAEFQTQFGQTDARITEANADEASALLAANDVAAVLSMEGEHMLKVELEGTDSTKSAAVLAVCAEALGELRGKAAEEMEAAVADKRAEVEDTIEEASQQREEARTALTGVMVSMPAEARSGLAEALGGLFNDDAAEALSAEDFSMNVSDYLPIEDMETVYLHGNEDWRMFDFYGPVFIGIFLFVFTFITSGMSLVTERMGGTMTRFLATPVNAGQILGGYTLAFGLLACLQSAIILWVALTFIGFPNEGNLGLVVFTCVSMAMVSVALGLLVSGLAATPFQVIQLILLFVVPQILLCGLFDLSGAPDWLAALSAFMPVTYGVDALRAVMLRGADLAAVGFDLAVLWGFLALFFALAAASFRKKRVRTTC